MTPERHQQIGDLYHRAAALPAEDRPALLDEACIDDPDLRREVESLLAARDRAGSFLDTLTLETRLRMLNDQAPAPGDRIGKYQVVSLLGYGGMGSVYLAEDTTLGRKVAIKLLPAATTSDAHALARFEHEARAASSLNHPNIVTIHEFGATEAGRFIVMECVEGGPLNTFIGQPMPIETLIPIARQLAEALAVAHAAGIVHRDVKPANVMLRPDGYIKLLDFGIARLLSAATPLPDVTRAVLTRPNAVIGTPRYMSPEQHRGDAATAASDVYALGAVLYELMTGRHVSEKETAHPIAGAVPPNHALRSLIEQMLDPNPTLRPRAAEVAAALQKPTTVDEAAGQQRRWLIAATATAAVVVAVAGALWWTRMPAPDEPGRGASVRFRIEPPANTAFSPSAASLALSPDGRSLAFTASQVDQRAMALWVQPLDSVKAAAVPAVKSAGQIFWMPDSSSIAYGDTSAQFGLRIVDLERGSVQPFENVRLGSAGVGSTSANGILARLRDHAIIHHIPNGGGAPIPVTVLDASQGEREHSFPVFLPDGRHFVFLAGSERPEHDGVAYVGELGSAERRRLFKSDSQVVYAHPGFLLYMVANTLLARPFDATTMRTMGEGKPVADQVERNSSSRRGAFSVSQTGVLAYRQQSDTQLVWYDRSGRRLRTLGPSGQHRNPALSPDGKTVAIGRLDPDTGTWDVWTIDVERQALVRVTSEASSEDMPAWSPDGTELAFKSDLRTADTYVQVMRQPLAHGSKASALQKVSSVSTTLHAWTRHGVFYSTDNLDLWRRPLSGDAVPVLTTPFWEAFAQPSPSGQWLAYASNETGAFEVYVTALAPGHPKTLVSVGGGTEPMWRADGRELFYLAGDRQLMAVSVKDGEEFLFEKPRPLFPTTLSPLVNSSYTRNQYVAAADGRQFLINEPAGRGSLAAITVVVNWPATLARN